RRHLVADLLRRPSEGAHRDHYAQHRRDDSQAGERIGHRTQCRNRLRGAVVMYLHVALDHLVEVEWFDTARGRHGQRVADEVAHVMVREKGFIFGENLALGWILDIALERYQTVAPGSIERVIQHLARFQIAWLAVFRSFKNSDDTSYDLLQNMQRIG